MPTEDKALREKLDAMVREEVERSLIKNGFGECDMDYQSRAITGPHLRALEVIALSAMARLDAAEARVKEIRRAWVEQDLHGFEAALSVHPVQVEEKEDE